MVHGERNRALVCKVYETGYDFEGGIFMKKTIKRFRRVLVLGFLCAMLLSSMAISYAYTGDVISPKSDSIHYYEISNKVFKRTEKELEQDIFSAWGKVSQYILTNTVSHTLSLTTQKTAGVSFDAGTVGATEAFTRSITKSFSAAAYYPADASRYSKLSMFTETKVYTADLYYVVAMGTQPPQKNYRGSGYVYEPADIYIEVVYQ